MVTPRTSSVLRVLVATLALLSAPGIVRAQMLDIHVSVEATEVRKDEVDHTKMTVRSNYSWPQSAISLEVTTTDTECNFTSWEAMEGGSQVLDPVCGGGKLAPFHPSSIINVRLGIRIMGAEQRHFECNRLVDIPNQFLFRCLVPDAEMTYKNYGPNKGWTGS